MAHIGLDLFELAYAWNLRDFHPENITNMRILSNTHEQILYFS